MFRMKILGNSLLKDGQMDDNEKQKEIIKYTNNSTFSIPNYSNFNIFYSWKKEDEEPTNKNVITDIKHE